MPSYNNTMPQSVQSDDEISALGEFGLIHHLTRDIEIRNPGTELGVGDDAAILDYRNKKVVVTTDLLTEGIHFNLEYTPLKHLGYKAAVVNFSDIFAMNAVPKQLLISIALSGKFKLSMVESLYDGLLLACKTYGVDMIGGDTSSSLTGLTISITVLGEGESGKIVCRSGACPNDLVCVSGNLGAAYMGLQVLERERKVFREHPELQPDLSDYNYILERQLKPEARGDIIRQLAKIGILPTSMIDISDGLSSEMLHICEESKVGCNLYADKIPLHPSTILAAEEFRIEPVIAALNGGEDYELLFTVPLKDFEKIAAEQGISIIGHITEPGEKALLLTAGGSAIELTAQGWNAIRR
jgi:thiamine-monophosphate kinase